ncbi:Scr1 family TA system antitoxin-like transcriptional regulator [Streptodolium elevatio]
MTVEKVLTLGGVIIFDFEANATSVVYTEHAGGMNAYHLPHDVRRHKREAARLKALALSPEESLSTIQARLREL